MGLGLTRLDRLPSAKNFTPTLTLPLKREGIFAQLPKSYETFPVVADNPKWLRNSPLFALMFAAANEKGAPIALSIANHLLSRW